MKDEAFQPLQMRSKVHLSPENDIQKLYAALIKRYPHLDIDVDKDDSGNPVVVVNTGDTEFYIVQKPNKNFTLHARWPQDEKGRKNLDAATMIKSLDAIPGMERNPYRQ